MNQERAAHAVPVARARKNIKVVRPSIPSLPMNAVPTSTSLYKVGDSGGFLNMLRAGSSIAVHKFELKGGESAKQVSTSRRNSLNLRTPQQEIPDNCKILTIKIEENYGNPDHFVLSALILLDKQRNPMPPLKITSIPKIKGANYETLTNKILVKEKSDVFIAPMKPEDCDKDDTVNIVFYIPPDVTPMYLRVWNPKFDAEANVKKISVYEGITHIYTGEIPQGFGNDISLKPPVPVAASLSKNVLFDLFPTLCPEPGLKDKYGSYPLASVKLIKIEILSTWSDLENENVGLNGIDILTQNNNLLEQREIQSVKIDGCKSFINIDKLFRIDKKSTDWNDMFNAEVRSWESLKPSIEIVLTKQTRLTGLRIWNFNASNRCIRNGIKNIKISLNNSVVFLGKVPLAPGTKKNDEKVFHIWFNDLPDHRQVNELIEIPL